MTEYYILNNIYRLLLIGEANRLGIINTDRYKDLVTKLLEVYVENEQGKDGE